MCCDVLSTSQLQSLASNTCILQATRPEKKAEDCPFARLKDPGWAARLFCNMPVTARVSYVEAPRDKEQYRLKTRDLLQEYTIIPILSRIEDEKLANCKTLTQGDTGILGFWTWRQEGRHPATARRGYLGTASEGAGTRKSLSFLGLLTHSDLEASTALSSVFVNLTQEKKNNSHRRNIKTCSKPKASTKTLFKFFFKGSLGCRVSALRGWKA